MHNAQADLETLKKMFEVGLFKEVPTITKKLSHKGAGWLLLCTDVKGNEFVLLRQRGGKRWFKTADAAISTAKQIGFNGAKLEF